MRTPFKTVLFLIALSASCLFVGVTRAETHVATMRSGLFDLKRYPQARRIIDNVRGRDFPSLGSNYEVMSPTTGKGYNCIAWSLGITNRWVWPGDSLAAFDRLNKQHGYRRLPKLDLSLKRGVDKIVLYGQNNNGQFRATHQSRQMSDGNWSSKLGQMPLIRHRGPSALSGSSYGQPMYVYVRNR
jgi:hypothetical protein